jgi:hypothetical protein
VNNCRYSAAAVAAAFLVAIAFGQAGDAEISGIVKDPSGAVVAGATATAINQDSGVTRSTTADTDGRYRFIALPPGRYSLKVEAPGFKTDSATDLVLTLGTHVDRNVTLTVGAVQDSVTVQGETPPIDTSRAEVAGVVTNRQIDTLPTNTRQYLNLALLMPGTTQDASRTFYNSVQIGGGGRYYANGFTVDGVTNTWAEMGEPRQNFPTGSVQEFKVNTNQYGADQGLAMGGMVNIVTKSGTNQFHGELFEYFRQKSLNREDKFKKQAEALTGTGKAPFLRNQYGGDVGGPIIKNRTHFHVAVERTQTDDSYTLFTGSAHQYYSGFEGVFSRPSHDQLLNIRGDHQISPAQHLFARYSQEWNFLSRNGCGGTTLQSCYDGEIPRHSAVVGHTWSISPSIVNDVRVHYAYAAYLLGPAGQPVWTQIGNYSTQRLAQLQVGLSFPSFSYGYTYGDDGIERRYQVKDDLTILKGRHAIKLGFDFSRVPFADDSVVNYLGTFTFGTDQVLNPNDPSTFAKLTGATNFTATTPPLYTKVPTSQLGFYIQEEWRARPDLTLTLGLRYDREFGAFNEDLNPATLVPPGATTVRAIPFLGDPGKRGDKNNFGPRFGLAWNIRGNGTDVVRLGYGIYYNNIQTLQNFPEVRNLQQCAVQISRPSYPDPFGGLSPLQFCSTAPPTVTVLAGDYANPYSQQFTGGYSRTIARDFTIHLDGVFTHTLRDYRTFDLNYPDATGTRPIAGWGRILYRAPVSQYKYKALYVRAEKRFARRYQFLVSYTLASNRDDAPQAQVINPANYNADWGPSSIDRRHTLVASGSVDLPWRFTLGAIWQVRTSIPFSALSNILDADGVRQYVPGTTRNQGNRGLDLNLVNAYRATLNLAPFDTSQIDSSRFNSFDVKVARPLYIRGERRIEMIGQVFNLFGVTNLASSTGQASSGGNTTNATSPNFGKILGALNLQQAELAVRIAF